MRRWPLAALVLLLAVVGGGIWLGHREPSPLLRITVVSGGGRFLAALDEWRSRFYIHTFGQGTLGDFGLDVLDTRTGALLHPTDIVAQSMGPSMDAHRPLAMIDAPTGDGIWIVDDRTFAPLLKAGGIDTYRSFWGIDEPTDTFYVVAQFGGITIADVPSGRVRAPVFGCTRGPGSAVVSHPSDHLFVPCADGTTEMRDLRTGRLLRSINTRGLSLCVCGSVADDLTGRVFVPGARALGVLDGRTGALLRTVPVGAWSYGEYWVAAHAGDVSALDPRTGNVVLAPYAPAGTGAPPRAVLVLDGRTGAIVHRWAVPENPTAVLVNPLTHHLLVASAGPVDGNGDPLGNGLLSVFDMDRGTILERIEVGITPGVLFADRHAGRLLVVNLTSALAYHGVLTRNYVGGGAQLLRWLKGVAGWLPFTPPARPPPPSRISVSLLDLRRL